MKKHVYKELIVLLLIFLGWYLLATTNSNVVAQTYSIDQELDDAISRMYDKWLTKYNTAENFLPAEFLTREQAAKFFWEFAKVLEKEEVKSQEDCIFNDLENADYTLVDHVYESCRLWLFKWSQWNYMPFKQITRAEAMTVITRTLDWFKDETIEPRWSLYHKFLRERGITSENDVYSLDVAIPRGEAALLLYRSATLDPEQETKDPQLEELKKLLLQLGISK